MINVRRSDGRAFRWLLSKEDPPDLGYCNDPDCAGWATGDVEEDNGIRWCNEFWQHAHTETWTPEMWAEKQAWTPEMWAIWAAKQQGQAT